MQKQKFSDVETMKFGITAKFQRDGEKWKPDLDSATQNYIETTGFISVQKKKFHFVDLCYLFTLMLMFCNSSGKCT